MSAILILCKVLDTKDFSLVEQHNLSAPHFVGYQHEFQFIENHFNKYGVVPDLFTFVKEFPNWTQLEVNEPDEFLLKSLFDQYQLAEITRHVHLAENYSDPEELKDYLITSLQQIKIPGTDFGEDITKTVDKRVKEFKELSEGSDKIFIPTGFMELDNMITGWKRGEDLVVFFARTGHGKSWVLTQSLIHSWKLGNNVGFISPEMSAQQLGYRFDTLHGNFSNQGLFWGDESRVNYHEYAEYAERVKENNQKFLVATPNDFSNRLTVSKLRSFAKMNKLDIIGIDGLNYMTDERKGQRDGTNDSLRHLCEDLLLLSIELSIPILVVVQANREGASDTENGPQLTHISSSDDIGRVATRVISINQKKAGEDRILEMRIKKNRYGFDNMSTSYVWNPDMGTFEPFAYHGVKNVNTTPDFGTKDIVF